MLAHLIAFAALVGATCPADLAASLHGCARGGEADCAALERRVVDCFGTRTDGDRRLGELLAHRLVALMGHPPMMLTSAIGVCRTGDCARLAAVVARLLSGDDTALDHGPDRWLARALAERLVADDTETSCASR